MLQVKGLFKELNVDFKLFELDQMGEDELALQLWRVLLCSKHMFGNVLSLNWYSVHVRQSTGWYVLIKIEV